MSVLVDCVLEQWKALVQREENTAYKSSVSFGCDQALRDKICEWCYQVIDRCDIDRSVVSFALSYFDRFMSIHTLKNDISMQLVSMTSLYLAVKIHSTKTISVSSMSSLSQGRCREDQLLEMEMRIIRSNHWYLNPPIPSIYLSVVDPLIDDSTRELSIYLIELSVWDGYFVDKKPSSISYAAIVVAMDILSIPKESFLTYNMDTSLDMTKLCVERLRLVYDLASPHSDEEDSAPPSSTLSPNSALHECI